MPFQRLYIGCVGLVLCLFGSLGQGSGTPDAQARGPAHRRPLQQNKLSKPQDRGESMHKAVYPLPLGTLLSFHFSQPPPVFPVSSGPGWIALFGNQRVLDESVPSQNLCAVVFITFHRMRTLPSSFAVTLTRYARGLQKQVVYGKAESGERVVMFCRTGQSYKDWKIFAPSQRDLVTAFPPGAIFIAKLPGANN
jgi:hypothetical protein